MTEAEARSLLAEAAQKRTELLLDGKLDEAARLELKTREAEAIIRAAGERAKLLEARRREEQRAQDLADYEELNARLKQYDQEVRAYIQGPVVAAREGYIEALRGLAALTREAAEVGWETSEVARRLNVDGKYRDISHPRVPSIGNLAIERGEVEKIVEGFRQLAYAREAAKGRAE